MMKRVHILNILGVLSLLGVLTGCQHNGIKNNGAVYVKTDTAKAVLTSFYDEIKGFGIIQAMNSLDLEAKFDGIVHFESLKGRIKKGDILYTLHGQEINLKSNMLQKEFANAKTQYAYFKQYYQAKKLLVEENFLSRIEFKKVVRDFDNAQNNLNKAQYGLNYFLSMTSYKAPFDGYLDYLQVPQGEDAVKGQLLGTFQDDDHIKLEAVYYGNTKALALKNSKVKIAGETYEGQIIYIEKAVDPSTGGHMLWVAMQDSTHQLKSGSYVSFSFLTNKHESVAVPVSALIQQQSNYFVVGVENKKYKKIRVQPGLEKKGFVEIKKGLKKGTVVLTKGAFEVFFGDLRKSMKVED